MNLNKIKKLSIAVKSKMLIALALATILISVTAAVPLATAASVPIVPDNLPTTTACGNTNSSSISVLLKQAVQGRLYVRLPSYSTTSSTRTNLYSKTLIGTSCRLIGSAVANTSNWTLVGNVVLGKYTTLVMQGNGLGAEPYAAAADILAIPNSGACQPSTGCTTTYGGYKGSIQPNLISGTSDQIAVYEATSISSLGPTNINYYADGTFLYSSRALLPINHNYLGGGDHAVVIQANFANGEKFIINQNINEGTDWSGTLYLRSLYYRSHNKLIFFSFVLIAVLILATLLWLVRLIYRRHRYKVNHGLNRRLK